MKQIAESPKERDQACPMAEICVPEKNPSAKCESG
jgi:hypothetical protein